MSLNIITVTLNMGKGTSHVFYDEFQVVEMYFVMVWEPLEPGENSLV